MPRQFEILGETPVGADPDDSVGDAHVRVPHPALVADTAGDVALGGDDVSRLVTEFARGLWPHLDDFAEQLVADDPYVTLLVVEGIENHVVERAAVPDAPVHDMIFNSLDNEKRDVRIIG